MQASCDVHGEGYAVDVGVRLALCLAAQLEAGGPHWRGLVAIHAGFVFSSVASLVNDVEARTE